MYLAGIDIGTTSICCVLVDAVTGQRIRVCDRANDASLISNQTWERIQDPDRVLMTIETMIEELGNDWGQVEAMGTRANPSLTGAISGIRDTHFTASHWIVGFLHGIVDELLSFADAIPAKMREQIVTAAVSGNGIRKNPAMRLLVEQKLGLPLFMSAIEEEAAFGAAIYAGAASGRFSDIRNGISKFAKKDEQPC